MADDKTIITDPLNMTVFQPPTRKRACLVQYSGTTLGRRFILDDNDMTIGRSPDAKICIQEPSVSREHASCLLTVRGVEIRDLKSSNGTFVNDKKVDDQLLLQDGDILRVGSILLKFFAHDNIENVFHDKIYRMATIDAGTQIFNKKYLLETLDAEIRFSRTYSRPLSLILYDLDFFKKVNDVYGHNAGDAILRQSSELAKGCIRKEDVLGRFGGEEFCVILPNTELRTAFEMAERIRKSIKSHEFVFDSKKIAQTVSLGVSELDGSTLTSQELLENADKKLYQSKNAGRDRATA